MVRPRVRQWGPDPIPGTGQRTWRAGIETGGIIGSTTSHQPSRPPRQPLRTSAARGPTAPERSPARPQARRSAARARSTGSARPTCAGSRSRAAPASLPNLEPSYEQRFACSRSERASRPLTATALVRWASGAAARTSRPVRRRSRTLASGRRRLARPVRLLIERRSDPVELVAIPPRRGPVVRPIGRSRCDGPNVFQMNDREGPSGPRNIGLTKAATAIDSGRRRTSEARRGLPVRRPGRDGPRDRAQIDRRLRVPDTHGSAVRFKAARSAHERRTRRQQMFEDGNQRATPTHLREHA
jgi:hypothetical protein